MIKIKNTPQSENPLMEVKKGNIVLFHPNIPSTALEEISETLSTRFQG